MWLISRQAWCWSLCSPAALRVGEVVIAWLPPARRGSCWEEGGGALRPQTLRQDSPPAAAWGSLPSLFPQPLVMLQYTFFFFLLK